MKPFVVNRYGRIVFPYNFFPALDFNVFETLEQFAAVIQRDFEDKAPSETDIVASAGDRQLQGALRAAARPRARPVLGQSLPVHHVRQAAHALARRAPPADDIFLPVFKPYEGAELAAAIESGYRNLVPTWDEGTEDKIFRILLDVFRHKKGAGAELSPIKPTVGEMLSPAAEPHLSPAGLRSRLSRLRLGRHRRVLAPRAGAGSADAPDDGAPQPVPLGSRQDAGDRGRQAPRRRLRGGLSARATRRSCTSSGG